MKENNDFIIKTIRRKIYKVGLLIPVVICLWFAIIALFFAQPANPSDEFARYFITGFFMIFVVGFGGEFYRINKDMRTALYIKENGRQYKGRVINAQKRRVRDGDHSRNAIDLLIEFKEGLDFKYIVSTDFIYELKIEKKFNSFDSVTNSDYMNDCEKIEHLQYMNGGYVTFDNCDGTRIPFIYKGSKIKNYLENDLECTVFELDGKYVVDNFEGYDEGRARNYMMIDTVIPAVIFITMFAIVIFLKVQGY